MGTITRIRPQDSPITLGEATGIYLESIRSTRSANTVRVWSRILLHAQREFGADTSLDNVDPDAFAAWFTSQWGDRAAHTWNVSLDATRGAERYWREQGWITEGPSRRLQRKKLPEDRDRALSREEIRLLLARDDISLREKTLWRMLYETAARASEVLGLNVEDLDLANRRAKVTRKGGAQDVIVWQTSTARLLPRLLKGRKHGPVFLTDVRGRQEMARRDTDPDSGRVRLSYEQARQIFKEAAGGVTLHQLRHSALTHLAEDGTNTPMLMAVSGHSSVRSLAKYARPSAAALQRFREETDPERR